MKNNMPEGFVWKKHKKDFGDVLYVQKKADEKTIKIARKARKRGVKVVYDCDDNPYSKPGKDRVTMLKLADAVTCDTVTRRKQLIEASGAKNVIILPECIDYWDSMRTVPIREKIKTVITFGNNANAVNSAKYMKYVDVECRHINSKKVKGVGKFIKWNLKTFTKEMSKADVCLLAHGDDRKSNLKLLVCFAMGIPAIVSDTKAYRDTMKAVNLSWLVAKKPEHVKDILRRIKSVVWRRDVVERYKRYDLSDRTPQHVAMLLGEVFKNVCKR
ncbi:MAG: glycosyltransferase family 4 protein [bacterium]|nr:glycosyltransferase family 4 protein [bacterium]